MPAAAQTRIKICGLTREEDVRAACALGADAVGFVCHPGSARYVAPQHLAALARAVSPFVVPVLLFVDAAQTVVREALAAVPNALLQFHGAEAASHCRAYGRPYLRAVPFDAGVDLVEWSSRFADAAALLVDAPGASASGGFGGAGVAFDWRRVPGPGARSLPLVLAGGLDADNVAAAIECVRPYGVDVSSGVEMSRGIKSAERMRGFIDAVRRADAQRNAEASAAISNGAA